MLTEFTDTQSYPKSKKEIVDKTKGKTFSNAAGKQICIKAPQLKTHFYVGFQIFSDKRKIAVLF